MSRMVRVIAVGWRRGIRAIMFLVIEYEEAEDMPAVSESVLLGDRKE
jgi:hypothetical protein